MAHINREKGFTALNIFGLALGARIIHFILLLGSDYGLALGLAILIALPAGAWIMHHWLEGFAFRTTLQPWFFIITCK